MDELAGNPEEEYSDQEEFQDNYTEEQRDLWDEQYGNYPIAKKPDSLFSLFKDVAKAKDSTKFGNLDLRELGDASYSVRDAQRLALLSGLLKHKDFGKYFMGIGEITLGTSMSKRGWFTELFVSTKKFAQKGTNNLPGQQVQQKQGWRIFGKSNQSQSET